MPDVLTSIEHLADIPLYREEKPYCVLVSIENRVEGVPTDNLFFERHDTIVRDIRGREAEFTLDTNGFTVLSQKTKVRNFVSLEELQEYQRETASFLKAHFNAEDVVCWEVKLRKNEDRSSLVRDLGDWTFPDRPAQGAHNDVTVDSGPRMIDDHMPDEIKEKYFQPGYRFRIVNTWRSLLPVLEDNPLALCDFRSINKEDLIAADRVLPTRAGEVYYLKHNPSQRWHWLENMTPDEPFLFVMYDSAPGNQARYCPHVPIINPKASIASPKRRSVETRSIIISRLDSP